METNNDVFNLFNYDNAINDELTYENNEITQLADNDNENSAVNIKLDTPQLATIERFAKYFASKESFDPTTGDEDFDDANCNYPLDENEFINILRYVKNDESNNRIITYNDLLNLKTGCADFETKYIADNGNSIGYVRYYDVTFFHRKIEIPDLNLQRAVNLDTSADLNQFNDYVEYEVLKEKTSEGYGCIVDIIEDDEIESY